MVWECGVVNTAHNLVRGVGRLRMMHGKSFYFCRVLFILLAYDTNAVYEV